MSVVHLVPQRFADSRGWFSETWQRDRLKEKNISSDFCQDNHSYSKYAGTLRGLHFQAEPHAQAKLVRCIRGRIFDVAVDIRADSPTFKKWVGVELSADDGNQLFIPAGFAHGFLTLEDDCEVVYKVDDYYAPHADGGIAWNDPDIAIDWPIGQIQPTLSDKDAKLPPLAALSERFRYNGDPLCDL